MFARSGIWALVLVALLAGHARAEDGEEAADALPRGKFGVSFGVRQGQGPLNEYGVAMVGAAEAGYLVTDPERDLAAGLAWSVVWGWFGPDELASLTGVLHILEFNFGGRLRRRMDESLPVFASIGSGVTLFRSNVPLPPEDKRVYVGPYLAAGVEQYWSRTAQWSLELRYGLVTGGPRSLSIVLGISFGR